MLRPYNARKVIDSGALWRDGERRELHEPVLLTAAGLVFWQETVARLEAGGSFTWVGTLRLESKLEVPKSQLGRLLQQLLPMAHRPPVDLPEGLEIERAGAAPRPRLTLTPPPSGEGKTARIEARFGFDYDGEVLPAESAQTGVFDPEAHRLIERDAGAERAALERLIELGFQYQQRDPGRPVRLTLDRAQMPALVKQLTGEGWWVEAEGEVYRQAGDLKLNVQSGIDWFELHGEASFDELALGLPELLQAIQRGQKTVRLGDGTLGMLPEQWLGGSGPFYAETPCALSHRPGPLADPGRPNAQQRASFV
jgi:hypothetical protein